MTAIYSRPQCVNKLSQCVRTQISVGFTTVELNKILVVIWALFGRKWFNVYTVDNVYANR